MAIIYNVYCDESCHLEKDKQPIMLFGAIWCPLDKKNQINQRIKEIKEKYNISQFTELKWTKISSSQYACYEELINYFFDDDDLNFRCLIVKNKDLLNYIEFNHNHDTFYYKMYYFMIDNILNKDEHFNIYIDIKDTKSAAKIANLKEILIHKHHYNKSIIKTMQNIRSHEIQIMQLTDIILGAFSYKIRGYNKVIVKNKLIKLIEKKSGHDWSTNSKQREKKFNIFYLSLKEHNNDILQF